MHSSSTLLNSLKSARLFSFSSSSFVSLFLTDSSYWCSPPANDKTSLFTSSSSSNSSILVTCTAGVSPFPITPLGHRAAASSAIGRNQNSYSLWTISFTVQRPDKCPTIPPLPRDQPQAYAIPCIQPLLPHPQVELA